MAVILLLISTLNFAQAPPLGTAANFVLFTTVGAVGNTGISQITGNVGTNSGAITGFGNVNGQMHSGDGATASCAADLLNAYNLLNSAVPTFFPAPLLGNGQILNAGVYSISGAATLNGILSLDAQANANAVFIFKIQGPLSAAASSKVKLINGALACNVFWKVEGLVSMAAGTTMRGTVIANNAAINMSIGDTLEGRALSTTGAVNVLGVLAYTPIGCGSPTLNGPAAPALASTACYALFSSIGPVSNAGITYVTGDVGTNVGLTTGFNPLFVTGMIHPIPDGSTAACAADLLNVYTYLNALPYDIELLYPAQFGHNLVLTPHTYIMNAATSFTDTLYLNALGNVNAVFVIKIYGALSTSTYSKVLLINGTQAKNVYWLVSGAVSINNYSIFNGTIVCNNGAIDLKTGVTLNGRALTTTGALGTTAITATMPLGCSGYSSPAITIQPLANQTVCTGSSVSFSVTATGTGLTYQWRKGIVNLTNGGNISGATSNTLTINPVNISDAAPNYNVVVSGTYSPSVTSNNASLVVNPSVGTPVFLMGTTSTRCQGPGTVTYTATATNNTGITYILDPASLAVGNTIVAATGAVTYIAGWVGVSLITATATGCSGPTIASHLATSNPRPGPTITGPASVCVTSCGNVYTTEPGMIGYLWTVSAGGIITAGAGTNSITVCWNTAGAQTVSINYTNAFGCPALAPMVFNVTVNALPVPTIAGPTPICMGSTGNVYTTQAGMTGYTWTVSAGGTFTGAGTNAITVTWNTAGAKTVSVSYTNANGCTAAAPTVFNVTVNTLPVPTISGQSSMCINSGYYNYTTESGMTNYVWSVSAGGVINYGSGTNQIQVSWIISGPQTVSVNYSNGLGCTAATPTVFNITVNPLPNQAGTITGTSSVCAGANGVAYSVAPIPNATSYVWTLPPNATIASGMGTLSITVNYGTNAISGNIFVNGNNLCGNGGTSPPFAVTVTPLPAAAGNITGLASVCQGAAGVVYTVPAIAGATGYTWTVPAGVNIVSGANTNSITVDFSLAAVSGNITVLGTNSCGNGTVSPNFAVTVNPIPAAPVVTNTGYTAQSSAPAGNQWYYSVTQSGTGAPISGATAQTYDATLTGSGYYWSIVTLNGCTSAESNHKLILVIGIDSHSSSAINVYPVPNDGRFTVSIISPSQEPFTITVFSNLGVKIHEVKDIHVNGQFDQVIDLRTAFNGIYTVVIRNSISHIVKKVVITR